eukprot:8909713-Pyramimonas_sp.AAC.1
MARAKVWVLLEVPLAQGAPRICKGTSATSNAPLTRPRGSLGLPNGETSWGAPWARGTFSNPRK